ncbi:MAG: nitroreductase [Verrucomicrobiaceae bacterium]|nr:nitroreductase [Verrucomicrobiaceae bacterium]
MNFSLEQVSALIRNRRSIKPASMDPARPVERATLLTLLENATWAPTHGMTEPWRFRVYEGAAREALADTLQRLYREVTPAAEQREDKYAKLRDGVLQAPTIIACSMRRGSVDKIPVQDEIEAVACALQNLMLSASAIGLGSFWSSPPLLESENLKLWLGLRPQDQCVGLLYLGWPKAGCAWPTSARKPLTERVSWA